MTVWNAFHELLTGPVRLLLEVIFAMETRIIPDPGLDVVILGLLFSPLLILLCRGMDQQRFLRSCNGKLKGIRGMFIRIIRNMPLSFLPEFLFLAGANAFFSELSLLHGAAFGPVPDLSVPDRLGGTISILPFITFGVRFVTDILIPGLTIKNREQFGSGKPEENLTGFFRLLFCLFLTVVFYGAPAGFALFRLLYELLRLAYRILCCLPHSSLILCVILSAAGFCILFAGIFVFSFDSARKKIIAATAALLLQSPLVFSHLRKKHLFSLFPREAASKTPHLFLICSIYLTIFTGILIPSTVIRSAPADFINISAYYSPLNYIFNALLLAIGTFVIWAGIIYLSLSGLFRRFIGFIMAVISICGTVNYMFFGTKRGIISNQLVYDELPHDTAGECLFNILILTVLTILIYIIFRKKCVFLRLMILVLCITKSATSITNIISISRELSAVKKNAENMSQNLPEIPLSTGGKNVIVFMLDRGIGYYIPFIMAERPELTEQFDGFTYYPNTVSFGSKTNEGAPALFGGYEYTPEMINSRTGVSLAQKHDEALRMMPVLFDEEGYKVTVIDPPYAGYQPVSDLSIYSDHPNITAMRAAGLFSSIPSLREAEIRERNRNFFCFSIYKMAPLVIQPTLYTSGSYNKADILQAVDSLLSAFGIRDNFEQAYSVLASLPDITKIIDEDQNTFFTIDNRLPHEPELLQLPDYTLEEHVDNSNFETLLVTREAADGRVIQMTTVNQVTHYHSDMASFILLGKWMDHLKQNGVYDNTRIIIAADHGQYQSYKEHLFGTKQDEDVLTYNPVLMFKDFNSNGFVTDPQLMTNADVPVLALHDLIPDPVNPATGNPISGSAKNNGTLFIKHTEIWDIRKNNGNTFLPGDWYALHGEDIFDLSSWEYLGWY